jgi:hypothetical protein
MPCRQQERYRELQSLCDPLLRLGARGDGEYVYVMSAIRKLRNDVEAAVAASEKVTHPPPQRMSLLLLQLCLARQISYFIVTAEEGAAPHPGEERDRPARQTARSGGRSRKRAALPLTEGGESDARQKAPRDDGPDNS